MDQQALEGSEVGHVAVRLSAWNLQHLPLGRRCKGSSTVGVLVRGLLSDHHSWEGGHFFELSASFSLSHAYGPEHLLYGGGSSTGLEIDRCPLVALLRGEVMLDRELEAANEVLSGLLESIWRGVSVANDSSVLFAAHEMSVTSVLFISGGPGLLGERVWVESVCDKVLAKEVVLLRESASEKESEAVLRNALRCLTFVLSGHRDDWVKVEVAHVHVVDALRELVHAFSSMLGVLSEDEAGLLLLLVVVLARAVGVNRSSDEWFGLGCLLLWLILLSLTGFGVLNLIILVLLLCTSFLHLHLSNLLFLLLPATLLPLLQLIGSVGLLLILRADHLYFKVSHRLVLLLACGLHICVLLELEGSHVDV